MERKKMLDLSWRTFRSAFKDGDQVVVERDDGKFFWGVLAVVNEEGMMLTRPEGAHVPFLYWDEVELVAHDGFPVKPLLGMTPAEAARRAKNTPVELIRAALEGKLEQKPERRPSPHTPSSRTKHLLMPSSFTIAGGCPFVAGPAKLIGVQFRGNIGPSLEFPETLVLEASDGAQMHSYDTDHLFLNI